MANARETQRQQARDFIQQTLRENGKVTLREMSVTGLSRAALIDLMREMQDLGLAVLTDQRAVYHAGPFIRYEPCTDESLQNDLLTAIERRPTNQGYWSDVLLSEYLNRPRDDVQRALVSIHRSERILTIIIGRLMIVRPPMHQVDPALHGAAAPVAPIRG